MAKQYATVAGIVALLTGVAGLFTGSTLVGFNSDIVEDLIHIVTGGLMAYVGLTNSSQVKAVVGAVGVVYLAVGVLGFIVPTVLGLLPTGVTIADNLLHLVLGVLGVYFGYFMKGGMRAAA